MEFGFKSSNSTLKSQVYLNVWTFFPSDFILPLKHRCREDNRFLKFFLDFYLDIFDVQMICQDFTFFCVLSMI